MPQLPDKKYKGGKYKNEGVSESRDSHGRSGGESGYEVSGEK